MNEIRQARVYDGPRPGDGARVLVDRLWPRGLSKANADIDEWLKEAAPSTDLRKWYAHDPAKHEEFVRRYRIELASEDHREAVERLRELHRRGSITLLTATRDPAQSELPVLVELLSSSTHEAGSQ